MKTRTLLRTSALAATLILSACGDSPEPSSAVPAESDSPQSLAGLFLDSAPANPTPVGEIVESGTPGETVTAIGRIGGAVDPFGEGYAIFFLADDSLLFCDEMGDDHCTTPWDACCEDPEKVSTHRLLVQIPDDSGEVLPVSLKGKQGLDGLDEVIVTGTLETAAGGGVVIDASGIYRSPTPASSSPQS